MNLSKILAPLLLFFSSCYGLVTAQDQRDVYEKTIASAFIEQEKTSRQLECIGTGLRTREEKIVYFSFIFLVEGNPSVEEARALIMAVMKDCAGLIARNPSSGQFLVKSPESLENIQIAIAFDRTDAEQRSPLSYVSSLYNKLYYSKIEKGSYFKQFYEETLAEAEHILIGKKECGQITKEAYFDTSESGPVALSQIRKELIRVGPKGKVFLPIFDDGAHVLFNAAKHLTPQERKHLHPYCYGDLCSFRKREFGDSLNIMSKNNRLMTALRPLLKREGMINLISDPKWNNPNEAEALTIISKKTTKVMSEASCDGPSASAAKNASPRLINDVAALSTSSPKDEEFEAYDKKITSKFIEQEKTTRQLQCIGTGLRVPEDKILYFSFIFLAEDNLSVEDARAMIVPIIKDCAKLIASDPDSSKFLIKSPESIENAQIDIFVRRTDGQSENGVIYVSSYYNKVYYARDEGEAGFKDFHEETFEAAEQILAKQSDPPPPEKA